MPKGVLHGSEMLSLPLWCDQLNKQLDDPLKIRGALVINTSGYDIVISHFQFLVATAPA